MSGRLIQKAADAMKTAGKVDPNVEVIRNLAGKRRRTFVPNTGGTKQQDDVVAAVVSAMKSNRSTRIQLQKAISSLPREQKLKLYTEIARQYPPAKSSPGGVATGLSPEGQFIIDFLEGRAEFDANQVKAIRSAEREARIAPGQTRTGRRAVTFDESGRPSGNDPVVMDSEPEIPGEGMELDPTQGLNRSSPRNPLRSKFAPLVEAGILKGDIPHTSPLRGPDKEVKMLPVDGRMTPIHDPVEGTGRLDDISHKQKRIVESNKRLPKKLTATDAQARLGNANPQVEFEQMLIQRYLQGSGRGKRDLVNDVWEQVKGPNAPSDPRAVFASPRDFAEYVASLVRPDSIVNIRNPVPARGIDDLKARLSNENFVRGLEGGPDVSMAEADRMAREAGLPRTGQEQLQPGLDELVDRLEADASGTLGDVWGDGYNELVQNGNVDPSSLTTAAPESRLPDSGSIPEGDLDEVPRVFDSPEAQRAQAEAEMRVYEGRVEDGTADLPETDLTGVTFPPYRERVTRPRQKAEPINDEILDAEGNPASPTAIADARTGRWDDQVSEAMKTVGMEGDVPRTPQQIQARIDEISGMDLTPEEADALIAPLQDEMLRSRRVSPHIHREVKTLSGWKRQVTLAAQRGDMERLKELGSQVRGIVGSEDDAVLAPLREFYAGKINEAKKAPAPKDDLPQRPEDGAPSDEELFSQPEEFEPDDLTPLKDQVGPNEGLDGNLEAASKSEIEESPELEYTRTDEPDEAAAASKAEEAEQSAKPAEEASKQDVPEESETPTDLVVDDGTLKGERVPGDQASGRTVEGKIEEPPKERTPEEIEAHEKRMQELDAKNRKRMEDFHKKQEAEGKGKTKDGDETSVPKDGEEPKKWSKGAKVTAGLGLTAGAIGLAALANRSGSPQSSGTSLRGKGNVSGALTDILGAKGGDASLSNGAVATVSPEDQMMIRKLARMKRVQDSTGLNYNTQTHANWTR